MRLVGVRAVGGAGQHLTLTVKHEGAVWNAIAFNQGWPGARLPSRAALSGSEETYVDLVYTMGVDSFRGHGAMQLRVLDFRPSGDHSRQLLAG